jgi:hypothetical protein
VNNSIRGKEYNRERAGQPKDYSGLTYGKITPTDIDGIVEFRDKLFVLLEYKFNGAEVPHGQKVCMERVVDAIASSQRVALAIVADHFNPTNQEIDCANASVRTVYYRAKWHDQDGKKTVKESIDRLLTKHGMGEYITHDLLSESSEQQQLSIAASQNSGMADGVDLSAAELEMFEGVMGYPAMWICYQSEIDSFRSKLRRDTDEK